MHRLLIVDLTFCWDILLKEVAARTARTKRIFLQENSELSVGDDGMCHVSDLLLMKTRCRGFTHICCCFSLLDASLKHTSIRLSSSEYRVRLDVLKPYEKAGGALSSQRLNMTELFLCVLSLLCLSDCLLHHLKRCR